MPTKGCVICGSEKHTKTFCFYNKKKKPTRIGRRGVEYLRWRDEVAIPYLDAKYGRVCSHPGCKTTKVDIDHILKRGSHPHLKMSLDNVRYLCRTHHIEVT